jgi:drug/metabolite transporter (DMT)-like permease
MTNSQTSPAGAARAPHLKADLALVAVTFIWGSTFVVVKTALADISTLLFLALRFGIATIALLFILGPRARQAGRLAYSLKGGALAGILLWAGYVLQTFGLIYTSPSKAGFLTGLAIPMVPLFTALFYWKAPRLVELTGVGAAAIGMSLMTLNGAILHIGRGDLLVILSAVAWALHIVTLGHFAEKGDTALLSLAQIAFAALLSLATFWWAEPARVAWKPAVWFALTITSLFATALAFSVQTWAQQFSTPTRTALIFALEGVFAWLTSFVLTGELLSPRATFGAGLILAGILLVELRKSGVRGN